MNRQPRPHRLPPRPPQAPPIEAQVVPDQSNNGQLTTGKVTLGVAGGLLLWTAVRKVFSFLAFCGSVLGAFVLLIVILWFCC